LEAAVARALTPKRAAFVREYLIDLNASAAARRAGYAPRTANRTGSELLSNPDIQTQLQAALKERAEKAAVSAEWVLERLRIEAEGSGPDTSPAARVRAAELLGKHIGMFTERLEHTGGVSIEVIYTDAD
jgi:phage terminase small subunit